MASIDASGGSSKTEPAKDMPKLELDLTKDTVTRGEHTSGLGEVFVQMDSNALADDIADLVLGAIRASKAETPWCIRVVTDPAAFRGTDTLALLTHQCGGLKQALDDVLGPPPVARAKATRDVVASAAGVANLALNGIGVVSQLLAHDYQMSGRTVDTKDLGFDVLLAQKLASKYPDGVEVAVDRIAPTRVAGTAIATAIADLHVRSHTALADRVTYAAAAAMAMESDVAALSAQRDALNDQIVELIRKIDTQHALPELADSRKRVATLEKQLTMARASMAGAKAAHDSLAALATEIDTFVTTATTTPANGHAPLVEAARAEAFSGDDAEYVLYARLVAGGMDEVVDVRAMRSDTWTALAGASVEYELLKGDAVVTSGVRSTLLATEFNLANVAKNKQDYVRYVPVPRFTP